MEDLNQSRESDALDLYFMNMKRERESAILRSSSYAASTNPDQEAEANKIGAGLGVSPENVKANIDTARQEYERRNVIDRSLAISSPILMDKIMDPKFTAVARDDIEGLSGIERLVKQAKIGWRKGDLTQELGKDYYAEQRGFLPSVRSDEIKRKEKELQSLGGDIGYVGNAANFLGTFLPEMPRIAQYAAGTSYLFAQGAAIAGQIGPQALTPEEVVTVPAAAMTGLAVGMKTGLAHHAFQIESGHAYNEALERGLDRNTAIWTGYGVGVVNALLEVVGFSALASPLKRGMAVLFAEATAPSLTKLTMGTALKEFGKGYAGAVAVETLTEVTQEIVTMAGVELAREFTKPEIKSKLETPEGQQEIVSRIVETAESTFKGMVLLGLPGPGIGLAIDKHHINKVEKEQEFFKSLGESVEDSKLLARDSGVFKWFVERVGDDANVKEIFVSAEALSAVLKQNNITPEQFQEALKDSSGRQVDIVGQLNGGGDVRIPIETYAADISPTPVGKTLMQHIRVRQDSLSIEEVNQKKELFEDFMKSRVQFADATKDLTESQKTAWQAEIEELRTVYEDQVSKTGKFSPYQSKAFGAFVSNWFVNIAKHLSTDESVVTPKQAWNLLRYKITADPEKLFSRSSTPRLYPSSMAQNAPIGAWAVTGLNKDGDNTVGRVADISVDDLLLPDLDASGVLPQEKQQNVQTYSDMITGGSQAPNIMVVEQEDGKFRVVDGQQRVQAAKMAGSSTVRAVVTPLVDTGSGTTTMLTETLLQADTAEGVNVKYRVQYNLDVLMEAAKSQEHWKDWYSRHKALIEDLFQEDAQLFEEILAVTSQATSVGGNVTIAISAYEAIISGGQLPSLLEGVRSNLEIIRMRYSGQLPMFGDVMPKGQKISEFYKAMAGKDEGVAVDRHIAMLLFEESDGKPDAVQVEVAKYVIRRIAKMLKWNPSQAQATLWAYNQVRLGKKQDDVRGYADYIEKKSNLIAAIRASNGRGKGRSVPQLDSADAASQAQQTDGKKDAGKVEKEGLSRLSAKQLKDYHAAVEGWEAENRTSLKQALLNPNQELIDVDGNLRQTRNSEGALIHSTEEGVRNFWRWFGDSTVIDFDGRPLVVFHHGGFDENSDDAVFWVGKGGAHFGTRQAANERAQSVWAGDVLDTIKFEDAGDDKWIWRISLVDEDDVQEKTSLMFVDEVFPSGNPISETGTFESKREARKHAMLIIKRMAEERFSDESLFNKNLTMVYLKMENPNEEIAEDQGDEAGWNRLIREMKKDGRDGIIYENEYEDAGSESWITWIPENIKSINNYGQFSKDPHVLKQSNLSNNFKKLFGEDVVELIEGDTIMLDGVARKIYNNEGKLISSRLEELRSFWKMFGDSLSVTEDGRPIVYYHFGRLDPENDSYEKINFSEFYGARFGSIEIAKKQAHEAILGYLISKIEVTGDDELGLLGWKSEDGFKPNKFSSIEEVYRDANETLSDVAQSMVDEDLYPLGASITKAYIKTGVASDSSYSAYIDDEEDFSRAVQDYKYSGFDSFFFDHIGNNKKEEYGIVALEERYIIPLSSNDEVDAGYLPIKFDKLSDSELRRMFVITETHEDNVLAAGITDGLISPSLGVVGEDVGGYAHYGPVVFFGTKDLADPEKVPVWNGDAWTRLLEKPKIEEGVSSDLLDEYVEMLTNVADVYNAELTDNSHFGRAIKPENARDVLPYNLFHMINYLDSIDEHTSSYVEYKALSPAESEELPTFYVPREAGKDGDVDFDEMGQIVNEMPEFVKKFMRENEEVDREDLLANIEDNVKVEKWLDDFFSRRTRSKLSYAAKMQAFRNSFNSYEEFLSWFDDDVVVLDYEKTYKNVYNAIYNNPSIKEDYLRKNEELFTSLGLNLKPGKSFEELLYKMTKHGGWTGNAIQSKSSGGTLGRFMKRFGSFEEMRRETYNNMEKGEKFAEIDGDYSPIMHMIKEFESEFDDIVEDLMDSFSVGKIEIQDTLAEIFRRKQYANHEEFAEEVLNWFGNENEDPVITNGIVGKIEELWQLLMRFDFQPTSYYEAKPQRLVKLSEFAGALVPNDASVEVLSVLARNGVRIFKYEHTTERDQIARIRKTALELSKEREDVFFQDSRGQFSPDSLVTLIGKSADFSTLIHETSHYFLNAYEELAGINNAPPRITEDFLTIINWFGYSSLDDWKMLSFEEKRKHHEAFAYNFEIWVSEGKVPDPKLESIFQKFREWMLGVYRIVRDTLNVAYKQEFGQDLPMLSKEVRQVMERMIVSEELVRHHENIQNMKQMFMTKEESGLSDVEWEEYQQAADAAREMAISELSRSSIKALEWMSRARNRIISELQGKHARERKRVTAEVWQEMLSKPVYRAIEFLRKGVGQPVNGPNNKLSLSAVKAMRPDIDPVSLGFGRYGIVSDKGVSPEFIGQMFGYSSGKQMLDDIISAKKIEDAVADEVDDRMSRDNSPLHDPKKLDELVNKSLHNMARTRFVGIELKMLSKSTSPIRVFIDAAREAAKDMMGKTILREVSAKHHSISEARAAAEVMYALRTGDTDRAYSMKRVQLLQNQLAVQANQVQKELASSLKLFSRVFQSDEKISKTRNTDYVNAAKAILTVYGLSDGKRAPMEYLEKIKEYNPELYNDLYEIVSFAVSSPKHFKDMTVNEFREMRAAVAALWTQARREKMVAVEGQLIELDTVVEQLDARMRSIGDGELVGLRSAPTKMDKFKRNLMHISAIMRRTESWTNYMDGESSGAFTRFISRPVKDALNAYRAERNKHVRKYVDVVRGIDLPVGVIESQELGYTFGAGNGGIGKAEVLGAILHAGNASNLRKLLLGRGWGEVNKDGVLDTSKWEMFLGRMFTEGVITKSDIDAVQEIWDINERIKPITQKAHHSLYGYYFEEVKATQFVTKFGVYRGGYVPASVDSFIVRDAQLNSMIEDIESSQKNSLPSTGRGFTKSRVEQYTKPLSLDIRLGVKHIDDALRFAFVQPAIKDVLKIIRHPVFADSLFRIDPTIVTGMLLPWLNRAGRQLAGEPGKNKLVDSFWKAVRARTGLAIMFANVRNALQQLTGVFPALIKADGKYIRSASWQYMTDPRGITSSIASMSSYMEHRQQNQMFDLTGQLNELVLNPSKYEKIQDFSRKHGYFMQTALQNVIDSITWTAVYNKSIEDIGGDPSDSSTQKEAVARADAAVRLTQSSLDPEDVSAIEVGTPFYKIFTQFMGYFNTMANLSMTEFGVIVRDLGWRGNVGKLFYVYLMAMALPALAADAIVRTLGNQWDDEDDDGYLDDFAEWFFGSQIRTASGMIPWGGAGYLLLTAAFDNKPYNDNVQTAPSITAIESSTVGVSKAAKNLFDSQSEITGQNVKDVFTLLTMITGIPLTVIGRPAGYWIDISNDKVESSGFIDSVRGSITGVAGEGRK